MPAFGLRFKLLICYLKRVKWFQNEVNKPRVALQAHIDGSLNRRYIEPAFVLTASTPHLSHHLKRFASKCSCLNGWKCWKIPASGSFCIRYTQVKASIA